MLRNCSNVQLLLQQPARTRLCKNDRISVRRPKPLLVVVKLPLHDRRVLRSLRRKPRGCTRHDRRRPVWHLHPQCVRRVRRVRPRSHRWRRWRRSARRPARKSCVRLQLALLRVLVGHRFHVVRPLRRRRAHVIAAVATAVAEAAAAAL
jgi:hypothetical protein